MSKTPYEIRLELLKLATEILQTPVHQKRADLMNEYMSDRECHQAQHEPASRPEFPNLPDYPTTADIIAEADKLNQFVSKG
jgi:hypothetical protein